MSRSTSPGLPLYNEDTLDFKESRGPSEERNEQDELLKRPSRTTALSITPIFSRLSTEASAARLETSLTRGLHPAEAQRRLFDQGPNELPQEEPEPLWLRFVKQFKETLILLLLASAAISAVMGNWDDAISIAVAVTIVVTVAFVQEYRSEKSLEALNRLVPHSAKVIRSIEASDQGAATALREHSEAGKSQVAAQHAQTEVAREISATHLVPGDLVVFTTGDRIPADVRITACAELSIDESNLTGENEPVHKQIAALGDDARGSMDVLRASGVTTPLYASPATGTVGADLRLNDQKNIAFMGTLVRSGNGRGIVVGTGPNTEFGTISASLQGIESPRTPLQVSMDRLGKDLSYLSFGVIGVIILIGLWRGYAFLDLFQIGVSLAVAAIPEGLPIIVTVTLALGVLRMSRRNAIVRRLPSVETLGSVNVICSDKTGTLTTNHMTVTKMWHYGDVAPVDTVKVHSTVPATQATKAILRIANVVNNARLASSATSHATAASAAVLSSTAASNHEVAKSRWSGQPTDVALLDLIDAFGEDDLRQQLPQRKNDTPFSSERKWMGCVIPPSNDKQGGSDYAYIKGALEQVLRRCDTYMDAHGSEVVLDEPRKQEAIAAAETMGADGLRVLGFASGPVSSRNNLRVPGRSGQVSPSLSGKSNGAPGEDQEQLYQGLCFAGIVGMNDPPRKGIDRSIRRLMAGGVKVIMITGDAETTAVAIAKKLGMPINMNSAIGSPVLRGDQIDRMSEEELAQVIVRTQVFARTSPEHKMRIVKALQSRGDVVAMTGDGVNDAPALKKADIGISMGKLGTDVAKEAADMILTDDDFSTILNAIEEGKCIFYNIQNFLTFQLSTSAAALGLVMLSSALGLKNPLNAMQILWINILMDGPPAQSLGVEPVDPTLLSLPPRPRTARVLSRPLIRRVLQSASIIMLGTLYTYWSNLSASDLASRTVSSRDTTLTFTQFVLFDMFNALTCRSSTKSVLRGEVRFAGNKMFNLAVGLSLLGQAAVVYFPPLQAVFQTEALGVGDVVRLVALASVVFWVDEGRKFLEIGRGGGGGGSGGVVGGLGRGGRAMEGYSAWV